MNDELAKELIWAVRQLTDAIRDYSKIKERGIHLAETIQNERESRVWVYP